MKYLRKFNESRLQLIKLPSIKHWLNPNTGDFSPFLNSAKYDEITDDDSFTITHPDDIDVIRGLSDLDKSKIMSVFKSCEGFKTNVNWDLINLIKDLSLSDFIDNGWKLNINVSIKNYKIYSEWLTKDDNHSEWIRYFLDNFNSLKRLDNPNFYYYEIRLLSPLGQNRWTFNREYSSELVNEVEKSYPDLASNIIHGVW